MHENSKICDKNLFSDNVEWRAEKLWKMVSADIKAIRKKELVL